VLRRDAITLSVSAGGSPALAARVRDELAAALDDRLVKLAEAMQTLRPMIVGQRGLSPEARRDLLLKLTTDDAMDILAQKGIEGLQDWLNIDR
jgi:siroheme synthase (precorrin-2 oxidase/ferrochelatase)